MTTFNQNKYGHLETLAMRQLDGSLTPAEHAELESLLLESATARRAYVEYFQDTASLRWLCIEELSGAIEPMKSLRPGDEESSRRRRAMAFLSGGVASILLLAAAGYWMSGMLGFGRQDRAEVAAVVDKHDEGGVMADAATAVTKPQVATLTGLGAVHWVTPKRGAGMLSRWAVGDRLQFAAGAIEMTFDAGVQVTIFGPADFDITSGTSIHCRRGRVTAVVGERGKGFIVQTPQAKVVDLGTKFGLSISEEGETEVVVFQGVVDMTYAPPHGAAETPTRRLRQGEALLLKNSGRFQRIVAVQRNDFLAAADGVQRRPPEPVIATVEDNIRTSEGVKSYQIVQGGLDEDVPCFVDRNHQWNGIDRAGLPAFLLGADYIMPFNDDKFVRSLQLKVKLLRAADLYVFLDNNMTVPDWLRKDFVDTGIDIGLDGSQTEWHMSHSLGIGAGNSVDFPFSVWHRRVDRPTTVVLGSVSPRTVRERSAGFNMYGIAAVAAD